MSIARMRLAAYRNVATITNLGRFAMSDRPKHDQQNAETKQDHQPLDESELSDEALESVAGGCEIGCSVGPDSQWIDPLVPPTPIL